MRQLLLFCACLMLAATAMAQDSNDKTKKAKKERTVQLYGEVYDSFTKAKLGAHVTLMDKDSTVIDTMTCWTWHTNSFYQFKVPAKPQKLIIKGMLDGYEDTYMDYELRYLARNHYFELPRLLMKRKQQNDDIWREDSLGGVVVRGTKVKIAYRGDTIVYNASAFNLPEGSMLDGLIRQLPGAELKANGDIYINGEKIDYLTLNGKDFFKGKNQVMLDNLPYYTVQNIKVFHQSTKQSRLMGKDIEKKEYVMDVNLKREYNRGLMGNVEGGGGLPLPAKSMGEARYLARLFALYYTDHSRYSVYGNVNNINENRTPGGEGEWKPSNMPQGTRITKQAGLDFSTEDADKRVEDNGSVSVEWSDVHNETRTASETFATEGSIFRGAWTETRQKDFRLNAHNELTVNKPFNLYAGLDLDYYKGRRTSEGNDSTYRQYVTNMVQRSSLNRYATLSGNGHVTYYKKLPWGDFISLMASGTLNYSNPSESFSRQYTHYALDNSDDQQERYADTHSNSYKWEVEAGYDFALPRKWSIGARVGYEQEWQDNHNSNYRLDWLGTMQPHDLGWLPSTRDSLLDVIDPFNCDDNQLLTHTYTGLLRLYKSSGDYYLSFELPYQHIRERLHYDDGVLDTIARRTSNLIRPSVNLFAWKGGMKSFSYTMNIDRPELSSLMPVDETLDPLIWRINNPELKNHVSHVFRLHYSTSVDSLKRNLSAWGNARIEKGNWGTRTIYDQELGSYTYYNDNVDGNWSCDWGASGTLPLDRKRRLLLTESLDADYVHSVDFDVQHVASLADIIDLLDDKQEALSTVNNWTLHNRLQLQYQKDDLTATLSGNISWRSSTGTRQDFQAISAFDFDYGASLNYTIPWVKIGVATDLRMYSRRGYRSDMMNDNHLVWNAQLSRSFLKGQLTAKIQAFDLLHQLSNTQYTVNAQGRTETWNNCIPRYLLLSLQYKFTKSPKQK